MSFAIREETEFTIFHFSFFIFHLQGANSPDDSVAKPLSPVVIVVSMKINEK